MPSSFPLFAMSIMIIQITYRLNPTLFAPCDGVSTVGGGVKKAGLRVVGGRSFLFQVFVKKPLVLIKVLR